MIILHDLAEAVTKDLPVWEGVENKQQKAIAEEKAIQQILAGLDEVTSNELYTVWQEYEQRESAEAKFVKALDTLDVLAQHNCAPIETWSVQDFLWQLSPIQDAFFNFDQFLRMTKDELDQWSIEKVRQAGQLEKLDQQELEKRTE